MANPAVLRILHISDLHFSSKGSPHGYIGNKAGLESPTGPIGDNPTSIFIATLKSLMQLYKQRSWPGVVIVNGDLVNTGGLDINRRTRETEFSKAIQFLKDIAETLRIDKKKIFIVPGNHDVTWDADLEWMGRFQEFIEATDQFTTVIKEANQLQSRSCKIGTLRDGTIIEVVLLNSSLYGGTKDESKDNYISDVEEKLKEELSSQITDQQRQLIVDMMKKNVGMLDLALIGGMQREVLRSPMALSNKGGKHKGEAPGSPGGTNAKAQKQIRIAVLHHHLLPDPHLGITQFEAVLDAGSVLDSLLDGQFDLVLSGHKHNRRLVRYEVDGRSLDVYTAPSLLMPHNQPGFTIIDLHGAESPYYSKMHYYNYNKEKFTLERSVDLTRNGEAAKRAMPTIPVRAEIAAPDYKNVPPAILDNIEQALRWRQEWTSKFGESKLLDKVWQDLLDDLNMIARRRLVLREPQLMGRWLELIKLVPDDSEIRLVSEQDLDYWDKARQEQQQTHETRLEGNAKEEMLDEIGSGPTHYTGALRNFKGTKTRILILDRAGIQGNQEKTKRVKRIINYMTSPEEGFQILAVDAQALMGTTIWRDFGIIGDVAVSFFTERHAYTRSLEERFAKADLDDANKQWSELIMRVSWDSETGRSFDDWLEGKDSNP
jgi:3',5'-cyclic AMP phosphodiesterase CpdA